MIDWSLIGGFDWDNGNARKSSDKHSVSQAEAEQVFFNRPLLVVDDARHSQVEVRFHAYGRSNNGRYLHVSFTLRGRGALLRIVSARDMHRKERKFYAQTP